MLKEMSPREIHNSLEKIVEIASQDEYKKGMSQSEFYVLCSTFGFDELDVYRILDCEEFRKPVFVEVPILASIVKTCREKLDDQYEEGTFLFNLRMSLHVIKFVEQDGKYGYEYRDSFFIVKGFRPETVSEEELAVYWHKELEPWQVQPSTQKRVEDKIKKWCQDENGNPKAISETEYFKLFIAEHPHKSNPLSYEQAEQCLDMDRITSNGYQQLTPKEIVQMLSRKNWSFKTMSGNDYVDYLPVCEKYMADKEGNIYEYRTEHSRLIRGIRDAFKSPSKKRSRK